jgi:hypothetical protein
MAFLTKYGTLWGAVPLTSGRIFWVAPAASYTVEGRTYSASDTNDGLSPENALRTVNQAVTNATADVGDIIMLLPGTYTFTATQTISKAGLKVLGLPGGPIDAHEHGTRTTRYDASVTTSAAAAVFTVTAARTEIAYVHIVPVSAQAGIDVAAADANFHDITWVMTTAANTATFGISVTGATARPRMSNFYVYVEDNQGPFLRCNSATGGMDGGVLQRSLIVLAGTTAWDDVIEIATGVDNFIIRDCDFMHSSGAVMTDVVDVTGNTNDHAVMVMRCMHAVAGDLTEATATSDIVLCNNYIATIQGGTGGTLSTG